MRYLFQFSLFTLFVLFATTNLDAQTSSNSKRLNDKWEYIQGKQGGIWEAWRDSQYQVRPWVKVTLPHCFNAFDAVDPNTTYYQGEGWYRQLLTVANPYPNGRTLLHFEGAGQKTSVYVYTKEVGKHVGGYDEFTVDLSDELINFAKKPAFKSKYKSRFPVAICADNSRDLEMIPSSLSDFNVYGGLYRYVNLVYVPAISIESLKIENQVDVEGKKGNLTVKVKVYNPTALKSKLKFTIQLIHPSGKELLTKIIELESTQSEFTLISHEIAKPELWSPSKPNLYQCKLTLQSEHGEMQSTERFGFRNFEFKEKGPFFLNGKRLLLQGTHRHEDHVGIAAAMTEEMMRTEMKLIKDMGVNFIRLGHYQQSRIILNLCDSLGIFVWEEIPWCRGGVGGETYREQARRMMRNMVNQHYNHPSVILWGLGNENDWEGDFEVVKKDSVRRFMQELNDLAHKLDPSRLTSIRRCSYCADVPDVYSPSIWAGWYRGLFTDYKKTSEDEMKKVKRFFHVEWGADNHVGRFSDESLGGLKNIQSGAGADERAGDYLHVGGSPRVSKDGDWSESYFCDLIDWHLKEQTTMDWLTGSAQWVFKDFSTPLRPENPIPFMNQKGIVERDFTKKEAYFVFQSYWAEKPMVHIFGQKWYVRTGKIGAEKQVKVYSNCAEVELFVNGISAGIKKRNPLDYPAAGFHWNVVFKEGTNNLKAVAKKAKETLVDEINLEYSSTIWGAPSMLMLKIEKEQADTLTLSATLRDKDGNQCHDGNQVVRFGLAGEGRLLDNLGTSTGSSLIQLSNGKAHIKMLKNKGVSMASVSSKDISTGFLSITSNSQIDPNYLQSTIFKADTIINLMKKVSLFQLSYPNSHPKQMHIDNNWVRAVLYTGIADAYLTTKDSFYLEEAMRWSKNVKWAPASRFRHADDLVCGQVYADLSIIKGKKEMIAPIQIRIDSIMKVPMIGREDWWWCDALYMAPPTLAKLTEITGNKKYIEYMNQQFWDTKEYLYDAENHLFFRDKRFFDQRTPNGKKIFWSRGNGWVLAGIVRILQSLPKNDPSREKYIQLMKEMAPAVLKAQSSDGLWRMSLLDADQYPAPETSGSAFFCFALAWGVNNGILDPKIYQTSIEKAWRGIVTSILPSGKLGYVQAIGAAPGEVNAQDTQAYGVGAFLLAGGQMLLLPQSLKK